jgi:hypothetical protein
LAVYYELKAQYQTLQPDFLFYWLLSTIHWLLLFAFFRVPDYNARAFQGCADFGQEACAPLAALAV